MPVARSVATPVAPSPAARPQSREPRRGCHLREGRGRHVSIGSRLHGLRAGRQAVGYRHGLPGGYRQRLPGGYRQRLPAGLPVSVPDRVFKLFRQVDVGVGAGAVAQRARRQRARSRARGEGEARTGKAVLVARYQLVDVRPSAARPARDGSTGLRRAVSARAARSALFACARAGRVRVAR